MDSYKIEEGEVVVLTKEDLDPTTLDVMEAVISGHHEMERLEKIAKRARQDLEEFKHSRKTKSDFMFNRVRELHPQLNIEGTGIGIRVNDAGEKVFVQFKCEENDENPQGLPPFIIKMMKRLNGGE